MTQRPTRSWPFPPLLAHRGGGSLAPENTLIGLRTAARHGFRAVEFDAKLTHDGVAILMHDDTLDRTTNGHGAIARADWRILQGLDAGKQHDPRFAGEPIPSLSSALELCQELGLWPNVEIKPCLGRERETGTVVAQEVVRYWMKSTPPLLSSFSPSALEAAREAAPQLPRGLLFTDVPGDWRKVVDRLGCFSLHCEQSAATAALLNEATTAGYPVLCYTVNLAQAVRQLLALGVSAVVTDRLDLISPA